MNQLFPTAVPVDSDLIARHTRLVQAPEMRGASPYRESPTRKRTARPGSVHGKGKQRVLDYFRGVPQASTLQAIAALHMHGDHLRRILRHLDEEGLLECIKPVNNGEHTPAIWRAVHKRT